MKFVIIEGVRTPIGKKRGLLSGIRAEELAAIPLKEVVKRAGVSPEMVKTEIIAQMTYE